MNVCGHDLQMTRGDTESIVVSCPDNPFSVGDEIIFTVKTNAYKKDCVMQKKITAFTADGKAVIPITPEDTAGMAFGRYRYDIQWTAVDGTVTTIIKPADFTLTEEVTW